jgi:hypothetical protein
MTGGGPQASSSPFRQGCRDESGRLQPHSATEPVPRRSSISSRLCHLDLKLAGRTTFREPIFKRLTMASRASLRLTHPTLAPSETKKPDLRELSRVPPGPMSAPLRRWQAGPKGGGAAPHLDCFAHAGGGEQPLGYPACGCWLGFFAPRDAHGLPDILAPGWLSSMRMVRWRPDFRRRKGNVWELPYWRARRGCSVGSRCGLRKPGRRPGSGVARCSELGNPRPPYGYSPQVWCLGPAFRSKAPYYLTAGFRALQTFHGGPFTGDGAHGIVRDGGYGP